ncbi:DUF3568 family protein [Propionivibrio sp.]|uniref:DUF3568 family protein n=1 Tax=Propionivibrio sp. TaxID=2212460 RepID=UPI002615EE2E|nr:DUF3568 family protein [Propionivibrio sp.]
MKKVFLIVCAILVLCGTTGCATLADAKAAKGTGSARVYDKPYETVWNATLEVVKASGLSLVNDDKARGQILAQNGISAFSYGENVAIFVEEVQGKVQTRVEVVNKRAMSTNVFAANWESRLLSALDKRL